MGPLSFYISRDFLPLCPSQKKSANASNGSLRLPDTSARPTNFARKKTKSDYTDGRRSSNAECKFGKLRPTVELPFDDRELTVSLLYEFAFA